jgi:uncharacterized glyoxalase superfamily protein PhnB
MVKFGYSILYVSDVSRAIGFYERAFGFNRKFITPENDYAELDTGQTTLAFVLKDLAHSNLRNGFLESDLSNKPFAMELGLVTDHVAETVERARQEGAIVLEEPIQKPWGQTVAYLRDPEGFLIEICTPIAM